MSAPTYKVRGQWVPGDWSEVGANYTWNMLADGFRWSELASGAIPDADVEQINVSRQVSNIFNRLSVGQATMQLDNSRGQYSAGSARTNLLSASEDFSSGPDDNGAGHWTRVRHVVTANAALSPTGTMTADLFAGNTVNDSHFIYQTVTKAASSLTVTFEIFVKASGISVVDFFATSGGTNGVVATFNIGTQVVSGIATAGTGWTAGAGSITSFGNGWYRCALTVTTGTETTYEQYVYLNNGSTHFYAGDNTSGVYFWGGQLELGSSATAYIASSVGPTTFYDINPANINDHLAVWAVSGTSVYGIYSGYLDKWTADPALNNGRKITVQAADIASRLRPVISTSLLVNPTQSTVFQAILSAASIPADRYALDQHNELVQFAFLDQITAGDAIAEVQQNGAQYIFVDGRGRLQIKNRNFDVPSLAGFGPYSQVFALSQSLDDTNIMNQVQVTTTPREVLVNPSTVGWISDPIFIPAAGSVQFLIDFVDPSTNERGAPVRNIQSLVAGVDFIMTSNINGGGTVLTSALNITMTPNATSADIQATNAGGANGYLTTMQVKGYPVSKQPDLVKTVQDAASIATYQARFQQVTADMLGTSNRILDLAAFIVVTNAQPKAQTTLGLKNEFPDVFQIDILQRIALVNSITNIGSSFIVQTIDHTIVFDAGPEHTLTMDLELAPTKPYFVLDSNALGHLDINQLGF